VRKLRNFGIRAKQGRLGVGGQRCDNNNDSYVCVVYFITVGVQADIPSRSPTSFQSDIEGRRLSERKSERTKNGADGTTSQGA